MPAMIRRSVLLPEPLGPTMPSDSPRATLRLTSRTAQKVSVFSRCRGLNRASALTFRSQERLCFRWKTFETSCSSMAGFMRLDELRERGAATAEDGVTDGERHRRPGHHGEGDGGVGGHPAHEDVLIGHGE